MAKCSAKVRLPDGRVMHGAAAQSVIIKQNGGFDAFQDKLKSEGAQMAFEMVSKQLANLERQIQQLTKAQSIPAVTRTRPQVSAKKQSQHASMH
jgi:uncharacterized protein YPO0396